MIGLVLSCLASLSSFISFVVQCKYVVAITFVHIIPLCPYIALFCLPLLCLLLSENILFDLVKLIMSGDIDSTFKKLGEWYPQVIKVLFTLPTCS